MRPGGGGRRKRGKTRSRGKRVTDIGQGTAREREKWGEQKEERTEEKEGRGRARIGGQEGQTTNQRRR